MRGQLSSFISPPSIKSKKIPTLDDLHSNPIHHFCNTLSSSRFKIQDLGICFCWFEKGLDVCSVVIRPVDLGRLRWRLLLLIHVGCGSHDINTSSHCLGLVEEWVEGCGGYWWCRVVIDTSKCRLCWCICNLTSLRKIIKRTRNVSSRSCSNPYTLIFSLQTKNIRTRHFRNYPWVK